MGAGDLNLPYDIPANEFLMFNGEKLSKSRGGAIDVPSVLQKYDADAVRYYLSVNMPDTHDTDFSWEDFQTKVNTELVSALGNYYHRCLSFTHKNFGTIPSPDTGKSAKEVRDAIASALKEYNECLSKCDFKKGIRAVMELARFGNKYFDTAKPWALIKTDEEECGKAMNNNLMIVKALAVMAWPFMPQSSQKIWEYLGYERSPEDQGIAAVTSELPVGRPLPEPSPVYKKIEIGAEEEKGEEISSAYQDFRSLDLRVGRIISAGDHPDAEKLLLLKVDIGEETPRQVVAGLKAYYSKEQLVGRSVIFVSNLKPAKLRGEMSQGMLLAADDEGIGGKTVLLLRPSKDVPVGTRMNSGLANSSSTIEYKDFQKVRMIVSKVSGGKFLYNSMEISLQEGSPARIAAVVDGSKIMAISDGSGCVATVDSEIMDGANVR
jgi:methionyl-tRNA synthetase